MRRSIQVIVALTACLLFLFPTASNAQDTDGDGFRDEYEQQLADMFCPSLVLQADDNMVSPEPVEIVTGTLWVSHFNLIENCVVHEQFYEGERRLAWHEGTNYSWMGNAPPIQGQVYQTINCGLAGSCERLYHFDYGGRGFDCNYESSDPNDQPSEPGGDDWYTVYKNGNEFSPPGLSLPNTVYAHQFTFQQNGTTKYVIQYWFFYPFNDWLSNHEGDWEHINVFISSDSTDAQLERVVYYFHHRFLIASRSQSEFPNGPFDYYVVDGTHPVVFVGGWWAAIYDLGGGLEANGAGPGSHGSYPMPGYWEDVAELTPLTWVASDVVAGDGLYIPWHEIVDADPNNAYGVFLLENPNYYDYDENPEMSWLKADMVWGRPEVNSIGSHLIFVDVPGNEAPRGPAHQDTWNSPYSTGVFVTYGGTPPYSSADQAGWVPPPPLHVEFPLDGAVLSDEVDFAGTMHYGSNMTIEYGHGTTP